MQILNLGVGPILIPAATLSASCGPSAGMAGYLPTRRLLQTSLPWNPRATYGLNLQLYTLDHFRQDMTRLSMVLRRHICQSRWLLKNSRPSNSDKVQSHPLVAGFHWWAPCLTPFVKIAHNDRWKNIYMLYMHEEIKKPRQLDLAKQVPIFTGHSLFTVKR